jgi:hypothetical protein
LKEGDLAAGALVIDPAALFDRLADGAAQLTDGGDGDGLALTLAHGGGIVLQNGAAPLPGRERGRG